MATILVFERDRSMQELLVRQLAHLGHEPVVPGDVRGQRADAVIIEPAMPGALKAAVGVRRLIPGLPIVFVSILPPSAETRALQPAAHVMKPYGLSALAEALAKALG